MVRYGGKKMKTLVILYGWQSAKERWQKIREEIEGQGIKVIVPDLPGFKKENELKEIWDLNDYLNWTREFVENISQEPIFLLGHSFGGRIAIKFAAKHPEKLRGLILVSTAGIKREKSFWQRKIAAIAAIFRSFHFLPGYEFFRKIFYHFIVRKTDYLKTEGLLRETFKNIIEEDLTPYLSQIKTKTLIIWGEKDKITPLTDAYLIKKEIQDSTLEIISGAGHRLNLEGPEKLSETILKFLENN